MFTKIYYLYSPHLDMNSSSQDYVKLLYTDVLLLLQQSEDSVSATVLTRTLRSNFDSRRGELQKPFKGRHALTYIKESTK